MTDYAEQLNQHLTSAIRTMRENIVEQMMIALNPFPPSAAEAAGEMLRYYLILTTYEEYDVAVMDAGKAILEFLTPHLPKRMLDTDEIATTIAWAQAEMHWEAWQRAGLPKPSHEHLNAVMLPTARWVRRCGKFDTEDFRIAIENGDLAGFEHQVSLRDEGFFSTNELAEDLRKTGRHLRHLFRKHGFLDIPGFIANAALEEFFAAEPQRLPRPECIVHPEE